MRLTDQLKILCDMFYKKDLVLVAVNNDEVLGYSCFDIKEDEKYDSELVSLYIKPDHLYFLIFSTDAAIICCSSV